jgi:hypothetical protein
MLLKRNEKMFVSFFVLLLTLIRSQNFLDYTNPESWTGNCQTSTTQSPININTKKLKFSPNIDDTFKYL